MFEFGKACVHHMVAASVPPAARPNYLSENTAMAVPYGLNVQCVVVLILFTILELIAALICTNQIFRDLFNLRILRKAQYNLRCWLIVLRQVVTCIRISFLLNFHKILGTKDGGE